MKPDGSDGQYAGDHRTQAERQTNKRQDAEKRQVAGRDGPAASADGDKPAQGRFGAGFPLHAATLAQVAAAMWTIDRLDGDQLAAERTCRLLDVVRHGGLVYTRSRLHQIVRDWVAPACVATHADL